MVFLIIPAEGRLLSSFLHKGVINARSRDASSLFEGVSGLFVYSDGQAIGPFAIVAVSGGSVRCSIAEPVRSVPYGPVRVPTRISDSMARRLLSSAGSPPRY